jgi:hypothetical protein
MIEFKREGGMERMKVEMRNDFKEGLKISTEMFRLIPSSVRSARNTIRNILSKQ